MTNGPNRVTTAAMLDDEDKTDRVQADLDAIRDQLRAIEAALPDYGPSFSALEQRTANIKTEIDKIAASPSVRLSAAQYASTSAQVASETLAPTLTKLLRAAENLDQQRRDLTQLVNALHIRSNRWPLRWLSPVLALVAGFILFPALARTVPGGAYLSAFSTGHRDPWQAGWRMMYDANPQRWSDQNWASSVLAANRAVLARCSEAALKTMKPQSCTVQVSPAEATKCGAVCE